MQVQNFDSKDAKMLLFWFPMMVVTMVMLGVVLGHFLTARAQVQTKVEVAAAAPRIDVNVPQGPAPRVENNVPVPTVTVNVPEQPAPVVNVTTAQPMVKILEREKLEPLLPAKDLPKAPIVPVSAPTPTPTKSSSSASPSAAPAPVAPPKDEEATLDALYKNAQAYIDAFYAKNGLQKDAANKKWEEQWRDKVEKSNFSEQVYINNWVLDNHGYFDVSKAKPEQIVEACRILLRYRDQNLAMLGAFNELLTAETIKKTVAFLAAGPK